MIALSWTKCTFCCPRVAEGGRTRTLHGIVAFSKSVRYLEYFDGFTGCFVGMIGPYIVGVITNGPSGNTVAAWRLVFYITAAVSVSCAIFFFIFASGELGDWEVVRPADNNETKKLHTNGDLAMTASPNDDLPQEEAMEGVTYGKVRYRARSIQLQPSSTSLTLA